MIDSSPPKFEMKPAFRQWTQFVYSLTAESSDTQLWYCLSPFTVLLKTIHWLQWVIRTASWPLKFRLVSGSARALYEQPAFFDRLRLQVVGLNPKEERQRLLGQGSSSQLDLVFQPAQLRRLVCLFFLARDDQWQTVQSCPLLVDFNQNRCSLSLLMISWQDF